MPRINSCDRKRKGNLWLLSWLWAIPQAKRLSALNGRLGGMTDEKHTFKPRMSFRHARTRPLVVEKIKRRTPLPTALLCPRCGGKMKLAPSAGSKLVASCPNCPL